MGFSGANNTGAELARGRLLLLLNSDVLPDGPGWVEELAAFLDETPNAGAVAPKLLFEDGSLQHAGLYFERAEGASLWSNEHYFKGLHGTHPAANVTRRVPAITAACMMLATDLYRDIGGLLGQYVQGDYEDSDLCMRLRARDLDTWYLASVALFHLEGQSYPTPMRVSNGEYNKWLHTHLWDEAIGELMASPASELRPPARPRRVGGHTPRNERVESAS
jgi:GT2 family glycosyltransferase